MRAQPEVSGNQVTLHFTGEFAADVGMVGLYVHRAVPSDGQGQLASLPRCPA